MRYKSLLWSMITLFCVFVALSCVQNFTIAQGNQLPDRDSLTAIGPGSSPFLKELYVDGWGDLQHIAWSPDGQKLMLAGSLGIWVYDLDEFDNPKHILPPDQTTWQEIVFFDDSRLLFVRRDAQSQPDGSVGLSVIIHIYDLNSAQFVTRQNEIGVYTYQFSQDRSLLALIYREPNGEFRLVFRDVLTGLILTERKVSSFPEIIIADDNRSYLLSPREVVENYRVYHIALENEQELLGEYPNHGPGLALSPDGRLLVTESHEDTTQGGEENIFTIHIWDTQTQQIVDEFVYTARHFGANSSYIFSPDGHYLVGTINIDTTRVWDLAHRKEIARIPTSTEGPTFVRFTPNSQSLFVGFSITAQVWNIDDFELPEVLPSAAYHRSAYLTGAVNPSFNLIAVQDGLTGAVHVWDAEQKADRFTFPQYKVAALAPEPVIVNPTVYHTVYLFNRHFATVWDLKENSRSELYRYVERPAYKTVVATSSSGQWLAVTDSFGHDSLELPYALRVVDVVNNRTHFLEYSRTDQPIGVTFNDDSTRLAVVGISGLVQVWDLQNLTAPIQTWQIEGAALGGFYRRAVYFGSAVYREQNEVFVIGDEDDADRIWFWSSKAEHELHPLPLPLGYNFRLLDYNPQTLSLFLAEPSGVISEYHLHLVTEPTLGRQWAGHTAMVNNIDFLNNKGGLFVTASDDGMIGVWHYRQGWPFHLARGHVGGVASAVFTKDAKMIISSGKDHTIRVWGIPTADLP